MLVVNDREFSFKTNEDVEAFAKWYLRTDTGEIESEFITPEEALDYNNNRITKLNSQVIDLMTLNFDSAIAAPISAQSYFKIVNKNVTKPLSAEGSYRKNSRFNYKNADIFQNRTIYFGQDRECCQTEMFHLDIQKQNYDKIMNRNAEHRASELPLSEYVLYEFKIDLQNILVLTSEPTFKALGIPVSVTRDEWFPVNDTWEIPTAGQILATIVRKQGYSGIMYTSVRNQTKYNLVLFEENTGSLEFPVLNKIDFENPCLQN